MLMTDAAYIFRNIMRQEEPGSRVRLEARRSPSARVYIIYVTFLKMLISPAVFHELWAFVQSYSAKWMK